MTCLLISTWCESCQFAVITDADVSQSSSVITSWYCADQETQTLPNGCVIHPPSIASGGSLIRTPGVWTASSTPDHLCTVLLGESGLLCGGRSHVLSTARDQRGHGPSGITACHCSPHLPLTTGSISLFTHYLHPSPWSRAWSLARTSGTILLLFLSYLGLGVCLHFSETENVEQEKYRGCKMAITKSEDPALSLEPTWWKEGSSICKLSSGYCGMHTYKVNIYIDK